MTSTETGNTISPSQTTERGGGVLLHSAAIVKDRKREMKRQMTVRAA